MILDRYQCLCFSVASIVHLFFFLSLFPLSSSQSLASNDEQSAVAASTAVFSNTITSHHQQLYYHHHHDHHDHHHHLFEPSHLLLPLILRWSSNRNNKCYFVVVVVIIPFLPLISNGSHLFLLLFLLLLHLRQHNHSLVFVRFSCFLPLFPPSSKCPCLCFSPSICLFYCFSCVSVWVFVWAITITWTSALLLLLLQRLLLTGELSLCYENILVLFCTARVYCRLPTLAADSFGTSLLSSVFWIVKHRFYNAAD